MSAHYVIKRLLNFPDSRNTYEHILVKNLLSVKFVTKGLLAIINLKCMVMCIQMIDPLNAIIVSSVSKIEGILISTCANMMELKNINVKFAIKSFNGTIV